MTITITGPEKEALQLLLKLAIPIMAESMDSEFIEHLERIQEKVGKDGEQST